MTEPMFNIVWDDNKALNNLSKPPPLCLTHWRSLYLMPFTVKSKNAGLLSV